MNILMWLCQGLLVVLLLPQGVVGMRHMVVRWRKPLIAQASDGLVARAGGVPTGAFPAWLVFADCLVSLLVPVLVVVPWWTGWYSVVTPLAAAGLVVFNVLQLATSYGRMFARALVVTGAPALVVALVGFAEL
ncbi:hypothetical protein [Actinomadura pelletieri]|uniref:hypothetical protein n=1 Tax=Actinomadura pelletieri TaxID=111805 RepID=UPI0011C425E8|nr:hypothetical protein [Actinomadura pelletieri]